MIQALKQALGVSQEVDTETLVEQYAAAKAAKAAIEAKLKEVGKVVTGIEDQLRAEAVDTPAEERHVIPGREHTVTLDAVRTKVKEVDKDRLLAIIGPQTWFALTQPGITDIRRYLNPDQLEEVLTEVREGNRIVRCKPNS